MPSRSTSSAARPHSLRALVHGLRQGPVLGHDPSGVAHEALEAVPRIGVLEAPRGRLGEADEAIVGERLEEILLGREVAVDRPNSHPCPAGDLLDPNVEAVLGEAGARGVQDAATVTPGVGALRALAGGAVARRSSWASCPSLRGRGRLCDHQHATGIQIPYSA